MHITLHTPNFSMLGSLNLPSPTSLRLSPETARPDRRISFLPTRQVICAAVAEATPELERRRYGRPPESLYEVLQVKQDASLREIKTAYRTLAKLYHPDVSAAAEAAAAAAEGKEFIEIHEAYARLSNPETRKEYDMSLRLSSISRVIRYRQPATDDVRARAGFYTTRRWETDQCW